MEKRDGFGLSPVARAFVGLGVLLVATVALGFVALVLSYIHWRTAAALCIGAIASPVIAWFVDPRRRTTNLTVLIPVALAALIISVLFFSTWSSQLNHDRRLEAMSDELCGLDLPDEVDLDCRGGSITNTGNGNSCRYWARATVTYEGSSDDLRELLEKAGISPTELDIFEEPMDDGVRYHSLEEEGGTATAGLSNQAAWQDQDDDLRCT